MTLESAAVRPGSGDSRTAAAHLTRLEFLALHRDRHNGVPFDQQGQTASGLNRTL